MGLIKTAMLLGGGYFIVKKLTKSENGESSKRSCSSQRGFDENQAPRNQQEVYHDQNRSQQEVYRDQKDFVPAPVYRDAQPQIQYNDTASQQQQQQQQQQMSPAYNGERHYGDEKAHSEGRKSFN
jgi:hypothetical protein